MPEGEQDRIRRLFAEGWTSAEIAELLDKESARSSEAPCRDTDMEDRLSGEEPAAAVYVRVSKTRQEALTSLEAQEAACRRLAESLGYRANEVNVYRDVVSGGGANA